MINFGFSFNPNQPGAPSNWVDQLVTFQAGSMNVYGTFRHPTAGAAVPAVLLIAGSGPTDRDGNSPALGGSVNTLQTLADWLSADGVASLRYDKLGSGMTGLGLYTTPGSVGVSIFEAESAAALTFLARQAGVDRKRLSVFGHSEGALYALLLATGKAAPAPPVHALGLLEPLSIPYLDVITMQVEIQLAQQTQSGQMTILDEVKVRNSLNAAVQSLRTSGKLPAGLDPRLSSIFNSTTARYLAEADRYDPRQLAAGVRPHMPVLVTCSDADIQVKCSDVYQLASGLRGAPADTTLVPLAGVDHVLKEDPSLTAAGYGRSLPFSSQLQQTIRTFATHL